MPEDLAIIFAYHFPPENAIGGLRPFRFYKYLSRLGYRVHVITPANVSGILGVDAQQIADPFVVRARQGMGWQTERAIRKFLLPGVVGSQWAIHAYRAALRLIKANPQYRVTVFSTFPPVGTHVAAYWLARRRNLPWIADFRDPLADNPVYEHISPFTKDLYRKLEKIFVRSADLVIANTDGAQEVLRQKYPDRADRIELIWNGFDPEDRLQPLPFSSPERKIVAHVGELYGGRTVSPILFSLRRLIDRGLLSANQFRVQLTGAIVEGSIPDEKFMAQAVKEGWAKLDTDRVPQKHAHQIIQTAQALLLIQQQSVTQVPGKLYEYLQVGRPILAFVSENSPVERILERSGVPYTCIYPSSSQDAIDRSVLEFFQSTRNEARPNEWFESEFNAQNHAAKLSDLIQLANRKRLNSPVLSQLSQD